MNTTAASQRYCAGCMAQSAVEGRCTQCRWSDSEQPEMQAHLPRHYLLVGRYYIGRVLGQGGFGVTYLARDLRLDRPVAIKEYLPLGQCTRLIDRVTIRSHGAERREQYAYGLKRFLEEAQSLARFQNHPCIVPIIDFSEANGTAYLVMAYLEGMTLKQHLANHGGRIPHATAVQVMLPVMDALRALHQHDLLHRDVSPDNIFVTRQKQVKLLDFGAARYAIGEHSQSLSIVLKPGYAPEEQYRTRGKQGPWTDVYATAATLYQCITGKVPPAAPDRWEKDELARPSTYCADLPRRIEVALLKGLAVRASDRFQTIEEFQRALLSAEDLPSQTPDEIREQKVPPHPPVHHKKPPPPPASRGKSGTLVGLLAAAVVIIGIGLLWAILKVARNQDGSTNTAQAPSMGSVTAPSLPEQSVSSGAPSQPDQSTGGKQPHASSQPQGGGPLEDLLSPKNAPQGSSPKSEDAPSPTQYLTVERANSFQSPELAEAWAKVDELLDKAKAQWAPDVITISLSNQCTNVIRVAIKFQPPDDKRWATLGWRMVGPGKTVDTYYPTQNGVVYGYAETVDSGATWDGSNESDPITDTVASGPVFFHEEGGPFRGDGQRTVKMFSEKFSSWGNHSIDFTCSENPSASDQ